MSSSPPSSDYVFTGTQDWFSREKENWKQHWVHVDAASPRMLEIGSWEGRSAVFSLTELCGPDAGSIVCVDHFDLMRSAAGRERFQKLTHNLAHTGKPYRIVPQFSFPALMMLLAEEMTTPSPGFDWIYIDGSHEGDDTLLDAELVWRLARPGALVVFDDYGWFVQPNDTVHHPKRGIDAFMACHGGEFEVVSKPGAYQMVLKKTSALRIGFLVPEAVDRIYASDEAFERAMAVHYSCLNLAYIVDSAHARAAAVSIRSALEHSKGRTTVYVIDAGLTPAERERLQATIPACYEVTFKFTELPRAGVRYLSLWEAGWNEGVSDPFGLTWARVDMLTVYHVLPVERAIYLDADTLVRGDLRGLFDVELGAAAIAAAPSGGTDGIFDDSVLVVDMFKTRERRGDLADLVKEHAKEGKTVCQVLNMQFGDGQWLALPENWRARNGVGAEESASIVRYDGASGTFAKEWAETLALTGWE